MTPEEIKRMLSIHRQQRKKVYNELHDKLSLIDGEINKLIGCCTHVIERVGDGFGARAECSVCGKSFGWWCPASSYHICEYPVDEECVHCGLPEERK